MNELIQSGLALHAGRLLEQYSGLTQDMSPAHKYEGTLALSVLQMLLTNCTELHRATGSKSRGRELRRNIDAFNDRLAEPEFTVHTLFPDEPDVTGMALLRHLRNAVSHPRAKAVGPPTTGYETVQDGSGLVSRFRFTDSPDLNPNGELTARARADRRTEPRIFTAELSLTLLTALAHHVAMALGKPALEAEDQYSQVLRPAASAHLQSPR